MSDEIDAVQRLKNEYRKDDSVRVARMKGAEEAATFLATYATRAIVAAKKRLFDVEAPFPDMSEIQTEWNPGGLLVVALEDEFVPASPDLSEFADTRDQTMHMAVTKFCCMALSEWNGGDRPKAAQRLTNCQTPDVANVHMRLSAEHEAWKARLRLDALLSPSQNTPVSMGVSLRDVASLLNDGDPDAIRDTKKRWHNSRDPKLPDSLGKCAADNKSGLYAPSAILEFVQKVEALSDPVISTMKRQLRANLRAVRAV